MALTATLTERTKMLKVYQVKVGSGSIRPWLTYTGRLAQGAQGPDRGTES